MPTSAPPNLPERPAPLTVAAGLVALEGTTLLVLALAELASFVPERATMNVTTTAFFGLFGAALLLCAWGLTRLEGWARSPIVLAQLIQLGVAWSFRGGSTTPVAVVLAAVAVAVLVCIFQRASTAALVDDPTGSASS